MSRTILETFLFSEILKSYWFNGQSGSFYFYRDKDQKEIDLLIEQNGVLYPIEFKKSAHPGKEVLRNFAVLEKLNMPIGHGGILSLVDKHIPLTDHVDVIPVTYL
jgi:predicted AAA+ superfamily ATPase